MSVRASDPRDIPVCEGSFESTVAKWRVGAPCTYRGYMLLRSPLNPDVTVRRCHAHGKRYLRDGWTLV